MGLLQALQNMMLKCIPNYERKIKSREQNIAPYLSGEWEAMAKTAEMERQLIKNSLDFLNYDKLAPYKYIPRTISSKIIEDIIEINISPPTDLLTWKQQLAIAPMVYGTIIHADYSLYHPGHSTNMTLVILFTQDLGHKYDLKWLNRTAERIIEMKESSYVPEDCKEFMEMLRSNTNSFCIKLNKSLTKDIEAWCTTFNLTEQKHLPGSYLPATNILPFLAITSLDEKYPPSLYLIPGKYYME